MSTTHIEVTLEQMLQMALGTPQITDINLSILHSFFDIVLKKLDCQYETVEIEGYDGACMESLLRQSRISPLPFNHDEIQPITGKLEKLTQIKTKHAKLEKALNEHFAKIRRCNAENAEKDNFEKWEKYAEACEEFCAPESTRNNAEGNGGNKVNCKLTNDANFIKKIKQCIEQPLMQPIVDMRKRLESLNVGIIDYERRLKVQCERLTCIAELATPIEELGRVIASEENAFMQAMIELQEMIHAKIPKIVFPALKKFIQTETEKIMEICKALEKKPTCAVNKKFAGDEQDCVSCKGKLTCAERPILIEPKTHKVEVEKKSKQRKIAENCSHLGPCLPRDTEQKLLDQLTIIHDATEEAKIDREMKKSCFKLDEHIELKYG